ncbi:hypothetical protein [Ornithobacterium rhinotracheale]
MSKLKAITAIVLIAEAEKLFNNYPDLKEVYLTADGQGFYEKEKAENHAAYLENKEVSFFKREEVLTNNEAPKTPANEADTTPPEQGEQTNEDENAEVSEAEAERASLLAMYAEKFGKKEPHNIGLEKLKEALRED